MSFEDSNLLKRNKTRTFTGKIPSADKHFIGGEVTIFYIKVLKVKKKKV